MAEIFIEHLWACISPLPSRRTFSRQLGLVEINTERLQARQQVAGNSVTAKALDNSLKRWAALTQLVDGPQC